MAVRKDGFMQNSRFFWFRVWAKFLSFFVAWPTGAGRIGDVCMGRGAPEGLSEPWRENPGQESLIIPTKGFQAVNNL